MTRQRAAFAGATAAVAWGLLEPIDKRIFRYRYSDVALLGQAVTRGRAWPAIGLTMHAANGATFGLAWRALSRRARISPVTFALVEHVGLFPLAILVDRHHPARGTRDVPRIFTWRAFGQATVRHLLFGWVLGKLADGAGPPLAARANSGAPAPPPPARNAGPTASS